METNFYKSTGISLIVGSFLTIITMLLHPSGGDIEQLIKVSKSLQIAHSLAIFSLPFMLFGFYGLTHILSNKWRFSTLAFIIVAFGLFAAMLAALFNGLALPQFLTRYTKNITENTTVLYAIMNYGFTINKALDYVFIIGLCLAIVTYSLLIISSNKLPKWVGYFGIVVLTFLVIGLISNFTFTSLIGFRIFVFSIAGWILFCGGYLIKYSSDK